MEKKILNLSVGENYNDERLDKFLQSHTGYLSRTKLQNLIREGCVKLNEKLVKETSKKIKKNDKIEIVFPEAKETRIKPSKISLNILYEDDDILVINKPPGMVVHPGAGNYEDTMVNALLFKYKNNLSSVGGKLRPGIVHRIDKDTSGAIVVAKNDNSHTNLSEQFTKHTILRTYEALVWGVPRPKNGKIIEKISRSKKNRQLMTVVKSKGKKAITNYKTLKVFENSNLPKISHVECKLETGRTHQIRVHMSFKKNPILGDKSYGRSRKKFKKIDLDIEKKINTFNRQALHANELGFIHPRTGENFFFSAERPKDFEELVKNLNKASL